MRHSLFRLEALRALQQRTAALAAFLVISVVLAWGYWHENNLLWSWDLLGVPRMPPPNLPFTDTISVTHSVDCLGAGFNPYLTGQCDPWNRLFNYPPIWLELRHVGISAAITNALGVGMAAVTAIAALLIFRTRSWPSFFITVLALLSPAILFGIERGNVDVLLFSIIVFGLFSTQWLGESAKWTVRGLVIIGLTLLKAYPIAACSIFLNGTKRGWLTTTATGFAAFAAFILLSWDKILFVFTNTPLTSFYSFGSAPLFLDLADKLTISGLEKSHLRWTASCMALLLGLALVGSRFFRFQPASFRLFPLLVQGRFLDDLCLACLSVFCFSFLLGSNFNYRLIFLVGTLAKLIEAFDEAPHWRLLISMGSVVVLLWATRFPSVMDHAVNWIVYIGACTWLAEAVLSRQSRDVRHATPL